MKPMTHPTATARDPVCGTAVVAAESRHSTTYRGMTFHFCSAQCLERFRQEPSLYATPTQVVDHRPLPKHRRLRILSADAATVERTCRRIREMMGVAAVEASGEVMLVEYDLRQVTLGQVEAVAFGEGVRFLGGLHGLRRAWWKFTESNELGNAAHPASGACCSRPPPRVR